MLINSLDVNFSLLNYRKDTKITVSTFVVVDRTELMTIAFNAECLQKTDDFENLTAQAP